MLAVTLVNLCRKDRTGFIVDELTLKNFRCFRDKQTVRLAPLTLLVGENSTGKTSLMAMIRALWNVVDRQVPDFKEQPYDLGSFNEIAHHRGARGGRAETFEAGFSTTSRPSRRGGTESTGFHVIFEKNGTIPFPVRNRYARNGFWIDQEYQEGQGWQVRLGTPRGSWQQKEFSTRHNIWRLDERIGIPPFYLHLQPRRGDNSLDSEFATLEGSPSLTEEDFSTLTDLARWSLRKRGPRVFAGAPVRSGPSRTYDPARPIPDPQGSYVPMYLASLYFGESKRWRKLQRSLQDFGQAAGLFDEILIRPLGKRDSEPFQILVRKYGGKLKGLMRNLIDVGYGVSQVLPVVTELLRESGPTIFLLQQPEVHLHPSAQAALGTLFCEVANPKRQLIVETHSDHLLDRVRMEVRDGKTNLKPDDVSILFFERDDLDVHIHSIRLDREGNVLGVPKGYRRFFLEETKRSLGL